MLPRLAVLGGVLVGSNGARIARKRSDKSATKTIAGIPVLNYDMAYSGASLSEVGDVEENWMVVGGEKLSDAQIAAMCGRGAATACKLVGHPDQNGVPFFEVRGTEHDLEKMLQGEPGLRFIEPNLPLSIIPEIVEPQSQEDGQIWGLQRIGRDKSATSGNGIHIHILDTGVRASHSEFEGRVVPTLDVSSGEPVECEAGSTTCAGDGQGHGTHCAGTAAGKTYGVAPAATVHSVKVLGDNGGGQWSWTIAGIDWVTMSGVKPAVASLSLGGSGRSQVMQVAVDTAAAAGVVIVVAAGNSNSDSCDFSPAFTSGSITVGSTTNQDQRSTFSNFGRCTQIWAPGSYILSASHEGDTESQHLSGTSMACPHVSGAAALQLEQNPGWTPAQVLEGLLAASSVNYIDGLMDGDVNNLLYVGADAPPPALPETTLPPSSCGDAASGPDEWGDCTCDPGYDCWWGDYGGCPYVGTADSGWYSRFYYLPSCATCKCWPMR